MKFVVLFVCLLLVACESMTPAERAMLDDAAQRLLDAGLKRVENGK